MLDIDPIGRGPSMTEGGGVDSSLSRRLVLFPPLLDGAKTHSLDSLLHRVHGGSEGASMSPWTISTSVTTTRMDRDVPDHTWLCGSGNEGYMVSLQTGPAPLIQFTKPYNLSSTCPYLDPSAESRTTWCVLRTSKRAKSVDCG